MTKLRYGIAFTYRCKGGCKWCNRFLDVLPWPDSDIKVFDLHAGWEDVLRAGLTVDKVRVTGGEPLLHSQFTACMEVIKGKWDPHEQRRIPVYTDIPPTDPPPVMSWRYKISTHEHQPPMISPADCGFEPRAGVETTCARQKGCGRLFDAYGFSFCVYAGAIGRVLGIDPYSPTPLVEGRADVCRHCPWTIGVKKAFGLFHQVMHQGAEYPSKTYREGLERCQSEMIVLPKYQERK